MFVEPGKNDIFDDMDPYEESSPENVLKYLGSGGAADTKKNYDEDNRNTTKDPFKGTSIEGKD